MGYTFDFMIFFVDPIIIKIKQKKIITNIKLLSHLVGLIRLIINTRQI